MGILPTASKLESCFSVETWCQENFDILTIVYKRSEVWSPIRIRNCKMMCYLREFELAEATEIKRLSDLVSIWGCGDV